MTLPATLTASDAALAPWQVVVIGAGPAGAVTAALCARRGLRTLLIDRAQFPRRKVCGCCLNANALAALSAAGFGHLPAQLGAIPLRKVQLAAGGRIAELEWPSGVSLSREALDTALIQEAITAGAAFLPGTHARMQEREDGLRRIYIHGTDSNFILSIASNTVLIADGLNGQLSGESVPDSLLGAGVVVPAVPWCPPGTIAMGTAPGGYVGLVQLEDGRLDVAAALEPAFVRESGGLGPAAASILKSAGFPAMDVLIDADWKGTPRLTRRSQEIAGEGWFAVGDACGYVEPFTGEGMGWAISSAVAIAPIVADAVTTGQNPSEIWTSTYRRLVASRQTLCRSLAWGLRRPRLCSATVRLLQKLPRVATPFLQSLHRPASI